MKHPLQLMLLLLAFSLPSMLCLAEESEIPTRELRPLTSTRVERIFYMNMDRIKIPVQEKELEAAILLKKMAECDRDQSDHGGTINQALLGAGWNPNQKIHLSKKESTYRTLLDEICAQMNLNWWVEDNPWIGVIIGPKSTYLEHKRATAFQSPAPDNPKITFRAPWWVPATTPKAPISKTETELLGLPSDKSANHGGLYNLRYILTFYPSGEPTSFEARIWARMMFSWPGNNSQIIEITKKGKRISAKKVGGEPIMEDAWGTIYSPNKWINPQTDSVDAYRFIYIRCRNRGIDLPTSIHTYRVDNDFTIQEAGVVLLKEDLEKQKDDDFRRWRRQVAPTP